MSVDEVDFCRQRAEQERRRAKEAVRKNVAEIHEELARLYDAAANMKQPHAHARVRETI